MAKFKTYQGVAIEVNDNGQFEAIINADTSLWSDTYKGVCEKIDRRRQAEAKQKIAKIAASVVIVNLDSGVVTEGLFAGYHAGKGNTLKMQLPTGTRVEIPIDGFETHALRPDAKTIEAVKLAAKDLRDARQALTRATESLRVRCVAARARRIERTGWGRPEPEKLVELNEGLLAYLGGTA